MKDALIILFGVIAPLVVVSVYLLSNLLDWKVQTELPRTPLAKSLYRNHVIVASGEFNQVTRQWKSMVCIFWKTDTQKLHSINDLAGIFETEEEAVAVALKAGKGWIDTQPAVKVWTTPRLRMSVHKEKAS